jgi:phosphoenolpyruvate synthase/pyruvate phosphate dikinase
MDDAGLRALEGQWVRLRVGASDYDISQVTQAEADAWWEEHRPQGVQVPGLNESVVDLRDVTEIVPADVPPDQMLAAIKASTQAFGGKAANYAAMSHVEGLRVPAAFAVPIYYYLQFMRENAFDQRVSALLADAAFRNDPAERDRQLELLRDDMRVGVVNAEFEAMLLAKLAADFPGVRMRFRSSTNAEDLDGFTGAGLYTSRSGDPNDPESPVLDAVRRVWSSVWYFRAFEERTYRSIDHQQVGMALLVHRSFPEEEANGVALTNNPFDRAGLEPAFYVNVQVDEFSVVQPEPGTTTEEFLYYFDLQSRPVTYLSRSNMVADGERVLSSAQVQELGVALDRIREHFTPAYAPALGAANSWWAMDVEFKLDGEPGETPLVFIKQARPFGNR